MTRFQRAFWACTVVAMSAGTTLLADVIVLRDGRRFDGVLVAVRGDTVEFEHGSGRDAGRVRRYDRADVRAIQFDDVGGFDPPGNDFQSRPGMRERTVAVDGRASWTDSGVSVRSGQEIQFVATGRVQWGPGRRDGAGGERSSPHNANRPIPGRNAAALIGKIGEGGDPFFIGDTTTPIRMRGSGRLFLGINDDYLQDNNGSLRVVISY